MIRAVRAATASDIPLLVELMEEFHAEAGYLLDRPGAARSFDALLPNRSLGGAWLVFDGDSAAGYVVLTCCFSMECGGLAAYIDDLFVRPALRRKGLGARALEALLADCRLRKVLAVSVEVGEDNIPANGLYRKFGLMRRTDRRVLLTARLDEST